MISRLARSMAKENFADISDLHNKLHTADDNPYLNYDALVEACDAIFGKRKAVPYDEFLRMVQESYQIDMEGYAQLHNFTDSVKLAEYFAYVATKIEKRIPEGNRSGKIIVVGCGQGRLAEVYIALAKKMGVREITFNDLIESHIQQTEQKIKKMFNSDGSEADGIKISYLPGDFATVDISGCFDAAFLIWYVGAEFLDPGSIENMRLLRHKIYSRINGILIPGGGLIEDIPDPNMDPGFYEIATYKTSRILKERSILIGEHKNLLLSNWTPEQTTGFPYQLRYTARNGADVREKSEAGFELKKTESVPLPIQSMYKDSAVVLSSLQDVHDIWEVIPLLHQLILQTVKFPSGDTTDQKRRKITWWEKPER